MSQPDSDKPDGFTYHSERARNETLAALAAPDPRVAAIHVELATRHVRSCLDSSQERHAPHLTRRH